MYHQRVRPSPFISYFQSINPSTDISSSTRRSSGLLQPHQPLVGCQLDMVFIADAEYLTRILIPVCVLLSGSGFEKLDIFPPYRVLACTVPTRDPFYLPVFDNDIPRAQVGMR